MDLSILLLLITAFFSFAILVIAVYTVVSNFILRKKYTQFYRLTWIDKKSGLPDNCNDTWGTFLYKLYKSNLKIKK